MGEIGEDGTRLGIHGDAVVDGRGHSEGGAGDADWHDQSHEHREGHIRRLSLENEEVIHLKAYPACKERVRVRSERPVE